jgi:hypothetical protein
MANQDKLLDYEEFKKVQNNFFLHFIGVPGEHHFGDVYRNQASYVATLASHPVTFGLLARELCDMFDKFDHEVLQDEEYMVKLYEAYYLMHPYAEKNWDLFA